MQLRDPRSLHSQFRISAHSGPVLSLDVKGDLLVTCGMSLFRREYTLEPAIKVPPSTTRARHEGPLQHHPSTPCRHAHLRL